MNLGVDEAAKLESLHVAASGIAAATTADAVYETAVSAAEEVLDFDACGVFVHEDGRLTPVAQTDPDTPLETYDDTVGVLGHTYQTGESVLVADAAAHEISEPADEQFRSGVSVAIGDTGVLQAISAEEGYYDETDLELAELLAIHVREAVTRIRSERDLRESKRKIERLHAVATSLESCTDLESLLSEAVTAADEVLEFDWCLLARREAGAFVVEAASERTPMAAGDEMFPADAGVAGQVVDTGESALVADARAHPVATPARESFRSGLVVPVGEDGVFAAVSDCLAAFDEQDLELAELLAASVGAARARIEARTTLRQRQADLDLLKDVYSRVLRHNLRNDLNVIGGAAAEAREAGPERTSELLDTIQRTADRLAATSERARQIKRVIDRTAPIREIDLREAVVPVVRRLRETAPTATITTDIPRGLCVRAHRDLPLAVRCLVENGVHHNDGDARVTVTARRCGALAELRVTDDGPGIPDHERSVIEANRETDLEHGSGAGLWLTRLVVDRSDGRLRFAEQEAETGTTVVVELPRADG